MSDEIDIPFTVSGQSELVQAPGASAAASEKAAAALAKQSQSARTATASYKNLTRSQSAVSGDGSFSGSFHPPSSPVLGSNNRLVLRDHRGRFLPGSRRPQPAPSAGIGFAPPPDNRLGPEAKAVRYVSGPNQRRGALQQQLAHATAAQDQPAIADIGRAIVRNEKQLAGRNVPPFEKRLDSLIRSTRFNAGGGASGVMPLIGQSADLLGVGAGPFGIALTVGEKALELFTGAIKSATIAGNSFGQLQTASGSSGSTTGALSNLGISADQATAFNEAITTDPTAMAFAASRGIVNAPGPYGQQDYGKEIIGAIKDLHGMKDQGEALRYARAMHLDGIYSRFANLSDTSFNQKVGGDANANAQVFSPEFTRKTAEFANSQERLGQSFTRLEAVVSGPVLNNLTRAFNEYADLFSGKQTWKRFSTGAGEDQYGNAVVAHTKALQDNTAATQDNSKQLGIMQRVYGPGGQRMENAIPRLQGMGHGYTLRQNLRAHAFRLGAMG